MNLHIDLEHNKNKVLIIRCSANVDIICTICTPPPLRAFQRDQEHDLKHPGFSGSHKYKQNKTNKLPSFIDRLVWPVPLAQV
jgi:hypothetical protein